MKVKFWGTRGSFPVVIQKNDIEYCYNTASYVPTNNFGGNTTCVEVFSPEDSKRIIIDSGFGITRMPFQGSNEFHIMFSHLHWDHIMGLNFFIPMFVPGNKIFLYSVHSELQDSVRTLFNGLNFPVKFDTLQSEIKFINLEKYKTTLINSFKITPFELDHPGKSYGYRIEKNNKSVATVFDTELTRTNKDKLGNDATFYEDLDLMIFDAQFDLQDLVKDKMNWGHASGRFAIDFAFKRNIRNIALIHHDPWASFEKLNSRRAELLNYYKEQKELKEKNSEKPNSFKIFFTQDNMEIDI